MAVPDPSAAQDEAKWLSTYLSLRPAHKPRKENDGARLGAGQHLEGPAIIEEPFTTIVPPGQKVALDPYDD